MCIIDLFGVGTVWRLNTQMVTNIIGSQGSRNIQRFQKHSYCRLDCKLVSHVTKESAGVEFPAEIFKNFRRISSENSEQFVIDIRMNVPWNSAKFLVEIWTTFTWTIEKKNYEELPEEILKKLLWTFRTISHESFGEFSSEIQCEFLKVCTIPLGNSDLLKISKRCVCTNGYRYVALTDLKILCI